MPNITTARDEIYNLIYSGLISNEHTNNLKIIFDDTGESPPDSSEFPWFRITIRHSENSKQETLSRENIKYSRRGILFVQIFTIIGTGLSLSDKYSQIVLNLISGKQTASGIWFRNPRINEVGRDKSWFQINVISDFYYEEIITNV